MKRGNLRITLVLSVLLADVALIHVLMSFQAYLDHDNKEACRTLSRDVILSLRTAVNYIPDRWTCLRIRSLGCAGRRRGCRGGKEKAKLAANVQLPIPTVTGRRRSFVKPPRCAAYVPLRRQRCLVDLRKMTKDRQDTATVSSLDVRSLGNKYVALRDLIASNGPLFCSCQIVARVGVMPGRHQLDAERLSMYREGTSAIYS